MAKKKSQTRHYILVIIIFAAFVLLGIGAALQGHTLVSWWIPAGAAAIPATLTAPVFARCWDKLSDFHTPLANGVIHLFVAGATIYFLVLTVNMAGADRSGEHVERTTVVEKFSREHTRQRRVGLHRYVPAGTYNTYHIVVEFADGRRKEQELSFSSYRNIRTGQSRDLTVARGLLGMNVIER